MGNRSKLQDCSMRTVGDPTERRNTQITQETSWLSGKLKLRKTMGE